MALKLFNSLGRRKMRFRALKDKVVKMYTCGPTVWDYAHIGNFRTFLFYDLLRRYLKFKGYKVVHVMNITDVEDRIIKGMKASGKSLKEHTSFYERAFMDDLDTLNIERCEYYPRASEHIGDIVELIKKLMSKGYAYKAADGSIYYDISKFTNYGELSGIRPSELIPGARVSQDHYEKEEPRDFALWKAWDPEDGDVFWETELGKGRPGWHIECSTMAIKYLGETIDIHAGGKDLKFPHHENEIAQSQALTGKRFVNYWLHSEFVHVAGEEMHKSLGNIVKLRDLIARGWDPMTIRLFLISSHYREPINLTEDSLLQAQRERERIQDLITKLLFISKKGIKGAILNTDRLIKEFTSAMDDDLNTPKALASLFRFIKEANNLINSGKLGSKGARDIIRAMREINSVLGFMKFEEPELPRNLVELIKERDYARKKGDFERADRIRDELLRYGIELEDTPSGTIWKKKVSG